VFLLAVFGGIAFDAIGFELESLVAMIFTSARPAWLRMARTPRESSSRLPLSSRTPAMGRPRAIAFRAPSRVS